MKFIFDRLTLTVVLSLFIALVFFVAMMQLRGMDTDFDQDDMPTDEWVYIEFEYDDIVLDSYFFGNLTLSVPTLDINTDFNLIFPELQAGYNEMAGSLDEAPPFFAGIFMIVPLSFIFIILRSVDVSW